MFVSLSKVEFQHSVFVLCQCNNVSLSTAPPLLFLLQFDVVSTFPSRFRVGATMLAKRESLKCMGKHFHLVKFRFDLACRVV